MFVEIAHHRGSADDKHQSLAQLAQQEQAYQQGDNVVAE
jgi:hypothetical protein